LINVIKVLDMSEVPSIQREMALVKVRARQEDRAEILRIVDLFRGRVINVAQESYIVEITGDNDKIKAFFELMRPFGIKDVSRTGIIAMRRER
jgi:acetolactate synthase-1/3 small subunit